MEGDDERARTVWCGNLSEKVSQEVLRELFLQAGPLERVSIPRDRDGRQKNFGFVTFVHEVSVLYAVELFRGTRLYERTMNLQSQKLPKRDEVKPMSRAIAEEAFGLSSVVKKIDKGELSVMSLQGQWSSRTCFQTKEKGSDRFKPYDRDRHRKNDDYEVNSRKQRNNETRRYRDHGKDDYSHNYRNTGGYRY